MAKPEQKKDPEDNPTTMLIKVIRPFKNYSPGDITGFAPDKAQALIDGGVAQAYEEE
jgi:hypothetical protein